MREEIMQKIRENLEDASIDEILRYLIEESSTIEVICCLDMIATEKGTRVAAFDWGGRIYPTGPAADLKIPDPPWKLDPTKKIKPNGDDKEILVPDNSFKRNANRDKTEPEVIDSLEHEPEMPEPEPEGGQYE